MATTVKEVIGMAYTLLNNASEEELDYVVALQQYGLTVDEMQHERISGYRNPEIRKAVINFTGTSEPENDTLTDFIEDVVFLRFGERTIEEVPVNMLDLYKDMRQQAVAFYTDMTTGTPVKKIALAVQVPGDLEIWYEPRVTVSTDESTNVDLEDSYKYLLAARLAYNCSKYVIFKDQAKEANKQLLIMGLKEQSSKARDLYLSKVNKIGSGNRPYSKLPYCAS